MRASLIAGKWLPESEADFKELQAKPAKVHRPTYETCIECGEPFSTINTHSPQGWAETQISGLCETCFDELFAEDEEEGE